MQADDFQVSFALGFSISCNWWFQVPNVGPVWRMRILSVNAGGSHSLAICETGELWACGRGRHGQLGFGNFEDVTTLRPIVSLRQGFSAP